MSKHTASFDKAERSALSISINVLKALIEGQKVEVDHGHGRKFPVRQAQERETNTPQPASQEQDEVFQGTTHT